MSPLSAHIKSACENLSAHSWGAMTGMFDTGLLEALLAEARQLESAGMLKESSVGRNPDRKVSTIRGDSTCWLDDDRCGEAAQQFLAALDALRNQLNQSLMLGLAAVEAHYAIYPAGAAYSRHRDRFRDDDARVLSLVCYLNPDWPEDAGGALRLYLPEGNREIAPRMGTSVIFLSEEIEHEVLPARQTRYSIAAWFRRRPLQVR